MRPVVIVVADVIVDEFPQLLRRLVLVGIEALCFHAAEPPLDHHVICPAAFPVHALPDIQAAQKPLIFLARELAPLV